MFDRFKKIFGASPDTPEPQRPPPQSPDESLALAREHCVYCADIVHQGVGSVGNLASLLRRNACWYFWWD